jgi:hypothetical protein
MKLKIIACVTGLAVLTFAAWTAIAPARNDRLAPTAQSGEMGAGPLAADPRMATLQQSPQARAYRERQDFEADSKRFLREAARLGPVEREKKARALSASIDKYEREGGLSAGEAVLLRTSLIKATIADETQRAARIAELTLDYRERADRRTAEYLAQHQRDPRFQDYKARERSIVAEVMAMSSIPGGLSRDQYLRQRLQQARELAYSP